MIRYKITLVVFDVIQVVGTLFASEFLDHTPNFFAMHFGINRGREVAKRLAFFAAERSPASSLDKFNSYFVVEVWISLIQSLGFVPLADQSFATLVPPGFGGWSRESRGLGDVFLGQFY